MRVDSISTTNGAFSVNSRGLTKCLKNRIYLDGQKDIEKIIAKRPNSKQIVGQLPAYVFNKIPKELRKVAIPEIFKVFDDVTNILRDYIPDPRHFIFDETERNRPKEVNDMLTNVFKKYGIIKSYDEIDLTWLGKGGRGKAYKITGLCDIENEDEYVLKVFYQVKGKNWHPFKSHGCYAELNSAMYWREQEGMDTHRGKFFFGSLGSAYMVTKYLDEDTRLPNRIVDEYKYGIKCTDEKKYKSKTSYEQDYNYVKDYNFDYGGMRVVNRLKNGNKGARSYMQKVKMQPKEKRADFWEVHMADKKKGENKIAGLALGIKHLDNKNKYVDRCLEFDLPKVNQALGYVLKYLEHEDALKYFEILFQKKDITMQTILFNEIPLLAKRKDLNAEMKDDITATLGEIIPERIYKFYMIAEKYAMPETVEHLASFVHLLPKNKMKQQYIKISNIENPALQERLLWKMNYLDREMQEYAIVKLSNKIKDKDLAESLIGHAQTFGPVMVDKVKETLKERGVEY